MNNFKSGRGLDVGTGMLCVATIDDQDNISFKSVRDSFLEITPTNAMALGLLRKGLLKSGVNFFEDTANNKIIVLGQDSLEKSVERQAVLQRPMQKGVISPSEVNAMPMFQALLRELLGPPQTDNERIVFTLPAAPIDAEFDIIYHDAVIKAVLKDLGYEGTSINEGFALALSELEDEDYSGLVISFGAGMSNIAIVNTADPVAVFSVAKGGDYIDQSTAYSLGFDPKKDNNKVTPNLVTFVKESGVDIINPDVTDRIQLGISAHYKKLLTYVVESTVKTINNLDSVPTFIKPITVVVAGGTSLAPGVLELLKLEFEKHKDSLPFKIKEVRHSSKPLQAVAEGCLLALLSE